MKPANFGKLLLFIGICQLAGLIGSLFTFSAIPTWYATLNKPPFSPPNFLFGPVWIILYTLMGISAYFVYQKGLQNKKVVTALKIFGVQLVLNTFWSIFFFGAKNPLAAFLEILFLLLAIILTIVKFYKISKISTYLLLPYLLWVSFAAILNLSIVILN